MSYSLSLCIKAREFRPDRPGGARKFRWKSHGLEENGRLDGNHMKMRRFSINIIQEVSVEGLIRWKSHKMSSGCPFLSTQRTLLKD